MSFEVVVRPVVFPNIRPAPQRTIAPDDNPDKGMAVIKSGSGHMVGFSRSYSLSWSRTQGGVEESRRVDEVRVYQKDDDGTINRDNFVDLQIATRISTDDGTGDITKTWYKPPDVEDNIEVREVDKIIKYK